MPPKVSILTPVYNAETTLARAVTSVREQDFADWEMILSDDASTDGSLALARDLAAEDPRIKVIHAQKNGGAARARNAALAQATGRYMAFLDADDAWLPMKLSRHLAFMETRDVAFSYTGFYRLKNGAERQINVPASLDYATLLKGNVIGCLTAIYDSAVFGKVEMPDIRRRQDYGLWLKLLKQVDRAYGLQEPLARYYQQAGSLSSARIKASLGTWQLYRKVEGLSRAQSASYLAQHLWQRIRS
ncbi:MAG: glycosyltransferase family 2 protein [Pseudomonadota bacterium]